MIKHATQRRSDEHKGLAEYFGNKVVCMNDQMATIFHHFSQINTKHYIAGYRFGHKRVEIASITMWEKLCMSVYVNVGCMKCPCPLNWNRVSVSNVRHCRTLITFGPFIQ